MIVFVSMSWVNLGDLLDGYLGIFIVVSFKLLASAQIVCNIVCANARSNPQGIVLGKLISI
jgi:hypothetical protein